MLEVKQPGLRLSSWWNGKTVGGSTKLYSGMFVQMSGNAQNDLGAKGNTHGGPKFARSGDHVVHIATSGTAANLPVFPVNTLIFKKEDADKDLDVIASGEYLVYYKGGEYEIDRYGTITTGARFGDLLYLDADGYLTTTLGAATGPRALFIDYKNTGTAVPIFDSNYRTAGQLWFRMLEV